MTNLAAGGAQFVVLGAIVVAILAYTLATRGWPDGLRSEQGGPEIASLVLAGYGGLLTAALARVRPDVWWTVPLVFLLLVLREKDFHDWFFEPGLLHTGIFSAPVPLWHKLVAGLVMLAVAALILRALWLGVPRLWRALVRREGWAYVLGVSGTLAFVANGFDGIGRKLEPWGIIVSRETVRSFATVEELLELAFYVGLLISVALYTRRHLVDA